MYRKIGKYRSKSRKYGSRILKKRRFSTTRPRPRPSSRIDCDTVINEVMDYVTNPNKLPQNSEYYKALQDGSDNFRHVASVLYGVLDFRSPAGSRLVDEVSRDLGVSTEYVEKCLRNYLSRDNY